MNEAARSCLLLTRVLRVDTDAVDDAALTAEGVDWPCLIRLADREHITTAFAAALNRRGLLDALPRPVRDALDRRHLMGTALNARIKHQAEEAVRILNAAGVTPMILKGALHLFEAPPEELGGRVLRDLDMVVPEHALDTSIRTLRDIGYLPEGEDEGWTYHYRPMHHPDHIVAIELHIRPGEQRNFLTIEEAWAEAIPVEAPGLQMVALGPTHRIAHNVFHSEIQDSGFVLGSVCLRQLYDLAKICVRFENAIDWQAIFARMERHGMGPLFRARMHLAVELFGTPRPAFAVDSLRSRLHLRRCLAQLRWPRFENRALWVAGVAGRILKRHHIDLLYGCGTTGLTLHLHRTRYAWQRMTRYRGDLWIRIAKHGQRLQRGARWPTQE